jgi:hypothetical protein
MEIWSTRKGTQRGKTSSMCRAKMTGFLMLVICKSRMKTMYIRISTSTRIRTRAQTNLESYYNRHHTAKFLAILASNDYNASHVSTCRTIYTLSLVFWERTTPYSMYCFLPSPELLLDHMPRRIRYQYHEMTTRSNYSSETLLIWSTSAEAREVGAMQIAWLLWSRSTSTTVETLGTASGCIAGSVLATMLLRRALAGEARRGGQDERDEEATESAEAAPLPPQSILASSPAKSRSIGSSESEQRRWRRLGSTLLQVRPVRERAEAVGRAVREVRAVVSGRCGRSGRRPAGAVGQGGGRRA